MWQQQQQQQRFLRNNVAATATAAAPILLAAAAVAKNHTSRRRWWSLRVVLGEPAFPPWSRREAEQYWDKSGRAGAGAFVDFEYNFPPPSESVAFAWHAVGAAQICSALVAMRTVMAEAKVNKWFLVWF